MNCTKKVYIFPVLLSGSMSVKSVSMSAPGRRATRHPTDLSETQPVQRVHPKTLKYTSVFAKKTAPTQAKCTKLPEQLHSTDRHQVLHTHWYIHSQCKHQVTVPLDQPPVNRWTQTCDCAPRPSNTRRPRGQTSPAAKKA